MMHRDMAQAMAYRKISDKACQEGRRRILARRARWAEEGARQG